MLINNLIKDGKIKDLGSAARIGRPCHYYDLVRGTLDPSPYHNLFIMFNSNKAPTQVSAEQILSNFSSTGSLEYLKTRLAHVFGAYRVYHHDLDQSHADAVYVDMMRLIDHLDHIREYNAAMKAKILQAG